MFKLLQWWRNRRARRHAEEFREWLRQHEEAHFWERVASCPCCGTLNPKGAHFCADCGISLQRAEQNTEPMPVPGPHTTKYRTVRLKPLEEGKTR